MFHLFVTLLLQSVINTKCLQTCASIRQRSYLIQNTIKEILTFIVNNIIMPFALFLLQIHALFSSLRV